MALIRSSAFAFFLVLPAILFGQGTPAQPLLKETWTVLDVIEPEPLLPNDLFNWTAGIPIGDVDRDGWPEVFFRGGNIPENSSLPTLWVDQIRQGPNQERIRSFAHDGLTYIGVSSFIVEQDFALARRPPGLAAVVVEQTSFWLEVLDLETGTFIGSVPLPPSPPGYPPLNYFANLAWAGDLNQDGYDEVIFQAFAWPDLATGLIDGKSLQVSWMKFLPRVINLSPTGFGGTDPPPDLNGDGVADYVTSGLFVSGGQPVFAQTALSGLDGTLLWTVDFPHSAGQKNSFIPDVDGDGVPDLAGTTEYKVTVRSGADGSVIWQRDGLLLSLDQMPPLATGYFSLWWPVAEFAGDVAQEGRLFLLVEYNTQPLPARGIIVLSASTGRTIGRMEMPPDLMPWNADPFIPTSWGNQVGAFPVGDVNRDGNTDLAWRVVAPSFFRPWTFSPSLQIGIFSQRTWILPDEARLGQTIQAELRAPAWPGRTAVLMASTAFDPDGGFQLGNIWNTNLGPSAVLSHSLVSPPASVTLGPLGTWNGTLRVPSHPALAGTTLFSRMVVTDAGAPGGVAAVSTLDSLVIRP